MKIVCRTLFDCTATGVVGHLRPSSIPFVDTAGQAVDSLESWTRSRNQQRNLETIKQLIALRAQPINLTNPRRVGEHWQFSFETESDAVYGTRLNRFEYLVQDCEGVPMVTNLDEQPRLDTALHATGPNQNIWFETINT